MVTFVGGMRGQSGKIPDSRASIVRLLKTGFYLMAFLAIGSLIVIGMLFDQGGSGSVAQEQRRIQQ